jgi:hypothetical protein
VPRLFAGRVDGLSLPDPVISPDTAAAVEIGAHNLAPVSAHNLLGVKPARAHNRKCTLLGYNKPYNVALVRARLSRKKEDPLVTFLQDRLRLCKK